jgi:hypothetical protein
MRSIFSTGDSLARGYRDNRNKESDRLAELKGGRDQHHAVKIIWKEEGLSVVKTYNPTWRRIIQYKDS